MTDSLFLHVVTMENFVVGKLFDTCTEIQGVIKTFEVNSSVKLYKKESRTIKAARKRCPNKNFKEDLKYSEIAWACIHNGTFKSKSTKYKRPNQKTNKKGCEFVIKIRVTPDGQKIMVTSVKDVHNHDVSAEELQLNPRVGKLDQSTQEDVKRMHSGECQPEIGPAVLFREDWKVCFDARYTQHCCLHGLIKDTWT